MSNSNWLYLIPDDPERVPEVETAERARELLRSLLPAASDVKIAFNERPTFVDPGANFELVACPQCGQNACRWWGEAMENYREKGADAFVVVTPCCGKRTSLDGLHYQPVAGFARFVLSAHNPPRRITRKESSSCRCRWAAICARSRRLYRHHANKKARRVAPGGPFDFRVSA